MVEIHNIAGFWQSNGLAFKAVHAYTHACASFYTISAFMQTLAIPITSWVSYVVKSVSQYASGIQAYTTETTPLEALPHMLLQIDCVYGLSSCNVSRLALHSLDVFLI